MAKFNIGDHVKIVEETEALRSLWGKTGIIESSSDQYFGADRPHLAVYEIVLDAGFGREVGLHEEWLMLAS